MKMVKQITGKKSIAATYKTWSACERIKQIVDNKSVVTILIRSSGELGKVPRDKIVHHCLKGLSVDR